MIISYHNNKKKHEGESEKSGVDLRLSWRRELHEGESETSAFQIEINLLNFIR